MIEINTIWFTNLCIGTYIPVDGTVYRSSKKISCDCCLTQTHSNDTVTYKHTALQGAVVHPEIAQVIPLMPEAIKNTDGQEKQDCEQSAAKRFLEQLKKDHPRLPILIGDDLFSRVPIFDILKQHGMHGIFTVKKVAIIICLNSLMRF